LKTIIIKNKANFPECQTVIKLSGIFEWQRNYLKYSKLSQ